MKTKHSIIDNIKSLGVKSGDTLFLRISYKAIGGLEGGPNALIDAILELLGPEGTIIASAFPKRQTSKYSFHKVIYEPGKDIYTGVIPKLMSLRPTAFFSSHPLSPFVCIGKRAKEFTLFHTPDRGNIDLLEYAMQRANAKCLRIGGEILTGTTHLAFSEGLKRTNSYQLRRSEGIYYKDENDNLKWQYQRLSMFCPSGYRNFFFKYIYPNKEAVIGEGYVGDGKAMLTDMKKTYEIEMKILSLHPEDLLCSDKHCIICRTSYSFSDTSKFNYFKEICLEMIRGNVKPRRFLSQTLFLLHAFRGTKCQ